ncbi:hypothetical protein HB364_26260 [Pseudoflavitalea sp. X16]|uniref:hypothetical protein n=1 Tax=Paraflavitalea devenefica TaxID=2716334 RepID=UPI00141EEF87|nr:hypothetical protein [Paraflavitalea devenefica]NII28615.1 hypothetical protein [Paraflavitalea devenefica]
MQNNTSEATNQTPPTIKADTQRRSASYPALTPLEAYNFALKVNNKYSNQDVTRKEIGHALNVHDLSISRDVAAAAAYGFFNKTLNKGEKEFKYQVTELFLDVFRYENEKQKKLALITAFGKPKLWQELISKFDGATIPEELYNTLVKHHSITDAASKEVADIFIRSGKEVGVINENRVLNYKVSLNAIAKTQYAEIIDETPNGNNGTPNSLPPARVESNDYIVPNADIKVPIHLTKNKMAYMVYPADINNKDIRLLDHAIKGILLRLELEKEEGTDVPPSNTDGNVDSK